MVWNNWGVVLEESGLVIISSFITSVIAVIGLFILKRITRFSHNRLVIPYIKTFIILQMIPCAYWALRLSKIHFSGSGYAYSSLYGICRGSKEEICTVVGIYLTGVIIAFSVRLIQYLKLRTKVKGSVPVENQRTLELFDEYKRNYNIYNVIIKQNDRISTAATVGVHKPIIMMPYNKCQGSEEELRIVLAHEFNHVKAHDVLWKYIALMVSIICWYNPFLYILLRQLDYEQEIECDINTCRNETDFTIKEYFTYMSGLNDKDESNNHFVSAFCMSKYRIDERIKVTGMKIKIDKPSKLAVFVMAALLFVTTSVPAYAAMDAVIDSYDAYFWSEQFSEEVIVEETPEYVEYTAYNLDDAINEVDVLGGATLLSDFIEINTDVPVRNRYLYGSQDMAVGDKITFSLTASDSSAAFRVGIRNNDSYSYRWVDVTGSVLYEFTIDTAASYSAYIYNNDSVDIHLEGFIVYYN